MYLKSINLRNVFNFGNEGTPELKDFKQFNLFIGKNGTGKTNVFMAFFQDGEKDEGYIDNIQHNAALSGLAFNERNFGYRIEYYDGDIQLFLNKDLLNKSPSNDNILFYRYRSSEFDLKDSLTGLKSNESSFLAYAFSFIFSKSFLFKDNSISELFRKNLDEEGESGRSLDNFKGWSSGYTSIAIFLIALVKTEKKIIFLDEPEIHLEPRTIKKLIELLFNIYQDKIGPNSFDEMIKERLKVKQYFIASHSPVLINSFIQKSQFSNIYQFRLKEFEIHQEITPLSTFFNEKSFCSVVKKIEDNFNLLMDDLGASGADLLQSNGIVWVEGPSDIIYLRKWLEMYALENQLPVFQQGIQYEFQMYGGTLLSSIYLDGKEDPIELVRMFNFSRNNYVITDSDAEIKDGVLRDKSKFEKAKKRIWKSIQESDDNIGMWYEKDNTETTTIEDYLDEESLKIKDKSKKITAQKRVDKWGETKQLTDFKDGLIPQLEKLYNAISNWNEL